MRIPLDASTADVLRLVLGQGLRLAAVGAILGLATSLALTRLLPGLLLDVSATDARTFAAVMSLLLATRLAACWIPARRVTRVDPVRALRYD